MPETGDKALEAILDHFRDRDRREAFYRFFREVQETYEILSPAPELRPFLEDYHRLVEMYRSLRSDYEPHVPVDKSFPCKTAEIVQRHTTTHKVREPTATYHIGPAALLALVYEDRPETVKVFNLLRELYRLVENRGREQPHLIPIGERAEAIRRAFEERQISSQQALAELETLVQNLLEAEAQRCKSALSPQAFALAWWARVQKGMAPEEAEDLAAAVEPAFRQYPHWAVSRRQEGELRKSLYKILLAKGVQDVVSWTNQILTLLRRAAQ